ncbi:methionyl-tRNA formyltransferase [candidate division NPL-UPA2 bacterium]|nr:methionyl-tRNA formyltransferase [candidate division NPL-UPA2 bacterium]
MRIVFMGTPQFALPSLKALIEYGEVVGVVSQPDRAKGRGRKVEAPAVKVAAESSQLPIYQPTDLHHPEFMDWLRDREPEVIIVVAYGEILPPEILQLPKWGCFNAHPSLLPKYRGAAPIEWAIIKGEERTGMTIILMNEKMDRGDIILQESVEIGPDDTAGILCGRLAPLAAKLLLKSLEMIRQGKAVYIPQDDRKATYAPPLKKQDGLIDWGASGQDIHNLVRGLNPRPGAYTYLRETALKVWETELVPCSSFPGHNCQLGKILEVIKDKGIVVATGDSTILIKEVQGEGGKRMSVSDYLRGHRFEVGSVLGRR